MFKFSAKVRINVTDKQTHYSRKVRIKHKKWTNRYTTHTRKKVSIKSNKQADRKDSHLLLRYYITGEYRKIEDKT